MVDNKEIEWLLKEKYSGRPTKNFEKDVIRLKNREPLDYIIGFTEFLGCRIDLSKKPLIPRPETEFWAEKAIREISLLFQSFEKEGKTKLKILDMFAGSGCIGIAVLKHIKNSEVVFSDNSKKTLKQIKINLETNSSLIRANKGYEKIRRSKIIQSNIFENIREKFDYIFANPPYIPNNQETKYKIQKSVLSYEPKNALFGGKDGLFYIKKFLKQAKNYLNSRGKIFMEFDPPQKKEIENLLKKCGYENWEFHKDQYNKWRWVAIVEFGE